MVASARHLGAVVPGAAATGRSAPAAPDGRAAMVRSPTSTN